MKLKTKITWSIVATAFVIIIFVFKIQILMALSMLEFSLFSQKPLTPAGICSPEVAFHRGYALGGTYPENSLESLNSAVQSGIKKIEIDVSIEGSSIFIGHDLSKRDFHWDSFLHNFHQKFQLLLIDVKEVKNYNSDSIKKLLLATKKFEKVIFIGRKCSLMYLLSKEGADVSCEAMGILAHRLFGWDWWSVNYEILGPNYQKLNALFPTKIIAWTFPTLESSKSICGLSPEIILVDKLNH